MAGHRRRSRQSKNNNNYNNNNVDLKDDFVLTTDNLNHAEKKTEEHARPAAAVAAATSISSESTPAQRRKPQHSPSTHRDVDEGHKVFDVNLAYNYEEIINDEAILSNIVTPKRQHLRQFPAQTTSRIGRHQGNGSKNRPEPSSQSKRVKRDKLNSTPRSAPTSTLPRSSDRNPRNRRDKLSRGHATLATHPTPASSQSKRRNSPNTHGKSAVRNLLAQGRGAKSIIQQLLASEKAFQELSQPRAKRKDRNDKEKTRDSIGSTWNPNVRSHVLASKKDQLLISQKRNTSSVGSPTDSRGSSWSMDMLHNLYGSFVRGGVLNDIVVEPKVVEPTNIVEMTYKRNSDTPTTVFEESIIVIPPRSANPTIPSERVLTISSGRSSIQVSSQSISEAPGSSTAAAHVMESKTAMPRARRQKLEASAAERTQRKLERKAERKGKGRSRRQRRKERESNIGGVHLLGEAGSNLVEYENEFLFSHSANATDDKAVTQIESDIEVDAEAFTAYVNETTKHFDSELAHLLSTSSKPYANLSQQYSSTSLEMLTGQFSTFNITGQAGPSEARVSRNKTNDVNYENKGFSEPEKGQEEIDAVTEIFEDLLKTANLPVTSSESIESMDETCGSAKPSVLTTAEEEEPGQIPVQKLDVKSEENYDPIQSDDDIGDLPIDQVSLRSDNATPPIFPKRSVIPSDNQVLDSNIINNYLEAPNTSSKAIFIEQEDSGEALEIDGLDLSSLSSDVNEEVENDDPNEVIERDSGTDNYEEFQHYGLGYVKPSPYADDSGADNLDRGCESTVSDYDTADSTRYDEVKEVQINANADPEEESDDDGDEEEVIDHTILADFLIPRLLPGEEEESIGDEIPFEEEDEDEEAILQHELMQQEMDEVQRESLKSDKAGRRRRRRSRRGGRDSSASAEVPAEAEESEAEASDSSNLEDMFDIYAVNDELRNFVNNKKLEELFFPPIASSFHRSQIHRLCRLYSIKSQSYWVDDERAPCVSRTPHTCLPHRSVLKQLLTKFNNENLRDYMEENNQFLSSEDEKDINASQKAHKISKTIRKLKKDGATLEEIRSTRKERKLRHREERQEKVAQKESSHIRLENVPIADNNIGHKLLRGLGWMGECLGAKGTGLAEPIVAVRRLGTRGLGLS